MFTYFPDLLSLPYATLTRGNTRLVGDEERKKVHEIRKEEKRYNI